MKVTRFDKHTDKYAVRITFDITVNGVLHTNLTARLDASEDPVATEKALCGLVGKDTDTIDLNCDTKPFTFKIDGVQKIEPSDLVGHLR